jgi:hypothetical protein
MGKMAQGDFQQLSDLRQLPIAWFPSPRRPAIQGCGDHHSSEGVPPTVTIRSEVERCLAVGPVWPSKKPCACLPAGRAAPFHR